VVEEKERIMLSIRTQDRMALVPYSRVTWVRNDGAIFVMDNQGQPYLKLGQYATQERALQVLDEIDKTLNKCPINLSIVYQMPKE